MELHLGWRFWLASSLLVHAGLMALGVWTSRTPAQSLPDAPLPPIVVEFIEPANPVSSDATPGATSAAQDGVPSHALSLREIGGVRSAQNISAQKRGERGDGRSIERGRLLAQRAESVNLDPNLLNTLRATQEQRMRTARDRASPQDRRSTPSPGYDPWISLRDGVLLYRLPRAETLPARGAITRAERAFLQLPSSPPESLHAGEGSANTPAAGNTRRPSAGVAQGVETGVARVAGPSALGHASIEQGRASTTADRDEPRPRDDLDAEALAASFARSSVAATLHQGPERTQGIGGVGGGGAPGSGGSEGTGGRARAYGEGEGWISLDAPDARYLRYLQEVSRRLHPLWANAFPRDEMLRLRQGTVILRFVIESNGRVRSVSVYRRSGIDAFDRNVAAAIAGAHLPAIPPEFNRSELRILAPFEFRNPIVR